MLIGAIVGLLIGLVPILLMYAFASAVPGYFELTVQAALLAGCMILGAAIGAIIERRVGK